MNSTIFFQVQGQVPVIAQPKTMACWATVGTMLMAWNDRVNYSIEGAMDQLGSDFRNIFESNSGLSPNRIEDFANATGMTVEYQRCETPESIAQLLENHGPIIIIDDEDSTISFAIHARIITGVYGNDDGSDTFLNIIDPNQGQVYDESFIDFSNKYEAMAEANGWNLQMMHY